MRDQEQPGRCGLIGCVACVWLFFLAGCTTEKQRWSDWLDPKQNAAAANLPPLNDSQVSEYPLSRHYESGEGAKVGSGQYNLAMRNPEFPRTHIKEVHIDLGSPDHQVRLVWAGPDAGIAPAGPFRSCPGRGKPGTNCDDAAVSNTANSHCTPKGVFRVGGFSDHLRQAYYCHYVTWVIYDPRYVAMHAHDDVAAEPRSEGCIRMDYDVARLIHNNCVAGVTLVRIGGTWTCPSTQEATPYTLRRR